MFTQNRDGFGMMWAHNNKIEIFKTLGMETAYKKYQMVYLEHNDSSDIILHFRIGSQGVKGLFNCHPFRVTSDVAFCHNGIITQYGNAASHRDKRSDTQQFNDEILKKIPNIKNVVKTKEFKTLVESFVVTDKLVFLNNDGTSVIINESNGVVDDYNWYSHAGFKSYTPRPYTTVANKFCVINKKFLPSIQMVSMTYIHKTAWFNKIDFVKLTGEEIMSYFNGRLV